MKDLKNVLKITGFGAGVVIIMAILSVVFDGGYWYTKGYVANRDARIAGIEAETPGQIDVLNVGDSLGDVGIAPMELYRDYGITSYTMGRDLQKTVETYYSIKLAMKNQPIKVVLWEVHNLTKHQKNMEPYMIGVSEFFKYKSPFIKYHYIWKNLIDGKPGRRYFKGFVVNEAVDPYEDNNFYDLTDERADRFGNEQIRYFRKICKLCRDNDIKLILYCVPSPYCYNIRMHNGFVKLAQEEGIDLLDGNYDLDKVQIDWKKDTFDKGDHLNLFGSRKMNKYLAEHIKASCDLADHRGDPAYQSWDDLWEEYAQEVKDMEGTSYPILEKEKKKGEK